MHRDGRRVAIRPEAEDDRRAVQAVNEAAFDTRAEAGLVAALRDHARPLISLVADDGCSLVGHIMFSPVVLAGYSGLKIMGLAPMAVLPEHQRRGTGSELVRAGIEECRTLGCGAVVVLGHPAYYPRFGFVPAAPLNIACEYDVPEDVFMIKELQPGCLDGAAGTIRYHEAFSNL